MEKEIQKQNQQDREKFGMFTSQIMGDMGVGSSPADSPKGSDDEGPSSK